MQHIMLPFNILVLNSSKAAEHVQLLAALGNKHISEEGMMYKPTKKTSFNTL